VQIQGGAPPSIFRQPPNKTDLVSSLDGGNFYSVVRCQEIAFKEFIFKIFLGSFAPSALAIPGYALKVHLPVPTTLDPRLLLPKKSGVFPAPAGFLRKN
jgi:hypothetical protein